MSSLEKKLAQKETLVEQLRDMKKHLIQQATIEQVRGPLNAVASPSSSGPSSIPVLQYLAHSPLFSGGAPHHGRGQG